MFASITVLCAAAAAMLPGLASGATLSGLGTISVINSSSFTTATPDMSIGCIDAAGRLVMNSCATFEFRDAYPNGIFTNDGNCSFTDSSQPANTDSRYGAGSYAWSCWTHEAVVTDQVYTVVSPHPHDYLVFLSRTALYRIPYLSASGVRLWLTMSFRMDSSILSSARATQIATLTSPVLRLRESSSCRSGSTRGAVHSQESHRVI